MASDKGKMAMDKMKLYLKSKVSFGPDGYYRKAHKHLVNHFNFWLNLLYLLLVRFPDNVQLIVYLNLFYLVLEWSNMSLCAYLH